MPRKAPTYKPPHARGAVRQWRTQCQDKIRGTAASRGYDSDWTKLRAMHLAEFPLCRECEKEGHVKAATEVDHVIPIRAGGKRLDQTNLQSLCKSHHSQKTMREMRERDGNTP